MYVSDRSELEKLSNNSACDIIGLVTFVGRVERVKSKGNKGKKYSYFNYKLASIIKNLIIAAKFLKKILMQFLAIDHVHLVGPEKYWTYRWIHAVDGTSGHPFILEVFSSSQPEIFSRICPSMSSVSAPV